MWENCVFGLNGWIDQTRLTYSSKLPKDPPLRSPIWKVPFTGLSPQLTTKIHNVLQTHDFFERREEMGEMDCVDNVICSWLKYLIRFKLAPKPSSTLTELSPVLPLRIPRSEYPTYRTQASESCIEPRVFFISRKNQTSLNPFTSPL